MRYQIVTHAFILFFALFIGFSSITHAAPLGSGITAGAGNTYPIDWQDIDSTTWNPAMLGIGEKSVRFGITPVSLRLTTDELAVEAVLRHLFSTPPPEDELSLPPGDHPYFDLLARSNHRIHVGVGAVSIGLMAEGKAGGIITRDILEKFSDPELSITYDAVAGTHLHWNGYYSFMASSAVPLVKNTLYGGMTLRTIDGWTHGEAVVAKESGATFDDIRLEVDEASNGNGFAVDLGLLWRATEHITLDVSWLNIGYIVWDDTRTTLYRFSDDEDDVLHPIQTEPGDSKTWHLPQTIRAGLTTQVNPNVRWAFNIERVQTKNENDNDWRISLGTETTRFSLLPIRLGFSYSSSVGEMNVSVGAGLRLGALAIDVGVPNVSALAGDGREVGFAITSGLRF